MRRARLKAVVRQCRHRGLKIRIDEEGDIEVLATSVMDTDHPSRKPVDPPHAYVYVTPGRLERWKTAADWVAQIFDACVRLSYHETAENFKYRGRRPFDPHPGVKRT